MSHPPAVSTRMVLGFVAGALAVLTFHQGLVAVLHAAGLSSFSAYRVTPVPPFAVPLVVSLSFWGGLYGVVFGLVAPRLRLPYWATGMAVGLLAAMVGMFMVAPIKGNPVAAGWAAWPMARSLLVNGFWGLGLGLILPVLSPRPLLRPALVRA